MFRIGDCSDEFPSPFAEHLRIDTSKSAQSLLFADFADFGLIAGFKSSDPAAGGGGGYRGGSWKGDEELELGIDLVTSRQGRMWPTMIVHKAGIC